ncbi:MAG: carbohydrate binding domain-containing protein [Kiritimatiellia bacterium]
MKQYDWMMKLSVVALGALTMLANRADANGNVYVSRFWHNHQPIYWPEWNGNGGENSRVQYAWDSIVLKPGQNYGGISPAQHPENNLTDIFGLDDRRNSYQSGPRNSLTGFDSRGGFAISYSGSLIDNVRQLGGVGQLGYGGGWNNGYREARGWNTPSGSTRMDLVGFTYHHSLAPLLPKSVFRKGLQTFKQAWWKAWGGNSDLSDHSKGFFPTEMGYSRHLLDVLVDEGYEWVIVASHHISRTSPSYFNQFDIENGSYGIYSSPPNKADQLGPEFANGWWYSEPNPGNAAWNVSPYAYQLHRVKYVDPETGAEKKMIAVPSDDVLSYRYGYANEGIGKITDNISPHANDPNRPVIVMPSTDGDNAWGGGSSSWFEATPQLFNESANAGYVPTTPQDFVNAHGAAAQDVHIEDGAWIFPESCYGSPNFLKWIEPPVATVANRYTTAYPGTQVDMETPGFALKFFSYAPLMAGANWLETAEQVLRDENGGNDMVNEWKVAHPYNWDGSWTSPNDVELAWHIYLNGLDSGFNYYGGLGNDDEVKPALATKNAIERLQGFMTQARKDNDRTPPTVLKPQRFPYNPGGHTFGWFNYQPGGDTAYLKKNPSWFYIWTHAYDLSGITNIKVKVRFDNDGVNPVANNDNETYAGGSSVGSWFTLDMQKRVLPKTRTALNAAAANGQIDYFVFDPAFWAEPVIADYYFTKIDESNLPGFRGKLLDYYVEATDAKGNVHKSEIQHVFVEDDGEGGPPPAEVSFSVDARDCAPLTVTYTANQGPLSNSTPVVMWSRFATTGGFTSNTMAHTGGGVSTYTFATVPDTGAVLEVNFQNADGTRTDNRGGRNYTVSIPDCDAPPGPVWTVPFTPIAGQPVTVNYDPTGRVLDSATTVNIHYGYNGGNWTLVPGESMTQSGDIWTYTYTVPADAATIAMVFNNDNNTWDNNGGANWNFDVDTQPVTNAPAAPTGLAGQAIDSSSASLSWSGSEIASAYLLYRDDVLIATPQDTSYIDNQLQPETTYSYYVVATNAIGPSPASATIELTTPFTALDTGIIQILSPANGASISNGVFSFAGRAAFGFDDIIWTNHLTGETGTIARPGGAAAYGWDWSAQIPLGAGTNLVEFIGETIVAANVTNSDSAVLYTTWSQGDNNGSGFNEWYFNNTTNSGNFIANTTEHTNMNVGATQGFGLYANNGGRAAVTRSFATPMKEGDSFAVRFDNNWIENGGQVGFEMRDPNGAVRFKYYFIGGEATYRIDDASSARNSGVAYTENGISLTLTLTGTNTYRLNTSANEITGTLGSGEAITWLEFFNNNAGPDTARNVYIGEMSHVVAATGTDSTTTNVTVTRTMVVIDSNGDGIPDAWFEQFPGVSPTNEAASSVPGGEVTYWDAYMYDVNPHALPTDFNRLDMAMESSDLMTILINPSSTARMYNVFWVSDLMTNDWSNTTGSFIPGNGGPLTFSITNNADQRYYRTGVKLPE